MRGCVRCDNSSLFRPCSIGLRAALSAALLATALAHDARGVVSGAADPTSIFNGVNVNQLVGAESFYANGYWGSRAAIANVEAGHVWDGHITLQQIGDFINHPSIDGTQRQYDAHATRVGHALVGQSDLSAATDGATVIAPPDSYWQSGTTAKGKAYNGSAFTGMAPLATLWSAAMATHWNTNGSFGNTDVAVAYAYRMTMQPDAYQLGRKADVVNSSWGYTDNSGVLNTTRIVDALAYAHGTTVVIAGGNHTTTMQPVSGPASGYNSITVAALASDTSSPLYSTPAAISNAGPNSFYNPTTFPSTIANARATVDIAAPGSNLTLAYYGGTTGSNLTGTDTTDGSPKFFQGDLNGTSYASPLVAGGAALLVDVGRDLYADNAAAIDGRVIKAVLLNSAAKTPGWNNGQTIVDGRVTTAQSLDYAVGAGRLDLAKAYTQFLAETADVPGLVGGAVAATGWDFATVAPGSPNTYILDPVAPHSRLAVTLDWFVNRSFNETTSTGAEVQMANLDLEVWRVVDGVLGQKLGESVSLYNNVEHLYFALPEAQDYALRVVWAGETYDVLGDTPDVESYGLAWQVAPVPEPSAVVLLLLCAVAACLVWRRRRM
jgi:hypothetical protein